MECRGRRQSELDCTVARILRWCWRQYRSQNWRITGW